ncbi:MAG: SirB2 family protein [Dechloromonas sp.]|nr:SirB2 family protein [Dechloromonas sp.]
MSYLALKHLHVTCVVLSGLGFCLRGWWMLRESPLRQHRLARVLPHVVDTLLLGSALTMAWMSGQYPFAQGWLTAKLGGLIAYILLGTMALKRGKTRRSRATYFGLALLAYAYIVSVALTRNPIPFA